MKTNSKSWKYWQIKLKKKEGVEEKKGNGKERKNRG